VENASLSHTEQDYIKAIFKVQEVTGATAVSTNDIAERLQTQPATVTDMIKRLAEKKIVSYKKYYGVRLTAKGEKIALDIIRKHRLWEVFLVSKLHFKWNEVHVIAEQLEHIHSDELITKLDDFLGKPKFDPHGDAIPDKHGNMSHTNAVPLNTVGKKQNCIFCGVANHEDRFLQYLDSLDLQLGATIYVESVNDYDASCKVKINKKHTEFFSPQIASCILVQPIHGK
jgi:DtxR family Mn-dependent transcriptional regulator